MTPSTQDARATGLVELAVRCEQATGADRELDALIRCAVFAPAGAVVEQSPINGAWCIYSGFSTRDPSRRISWEPRDLTQLQRLGEFTASLDAAMTLIDAPFDHIEVCPPQGEYTGWTVHIIAPTRGLADTRTGYAATYALSLTAAAIRALAASTKGQPHDA